MTDAKKPLEKWTVVELKAELKERGLSTNVSYKLMINLCYTILMRTMHRRE